MDITVVSLALTSVTALAAVIGPIVSSAITVRSNERTKRFEQYAPQLYTAVQRFSNAYSDYPRLSELAARNKNREALVDMAKYKYKELSAAAYNVISFIPDEEIHAQTIAFLNSIQASELATPKEDAMFQELSALLAKELASQLSDKRKTNCRRPKSNSSK